MKNKKSVKSSKMSATPAKNVIKTPSSVNENAIVIKELIIQQNYSEQKISTAECSYEKPSVNFAVNSAPEFRLSGRVCLGSKNHTTPNQYVEFRLNDEELSQIEVVVKQAVKRIQANFS